MTESVVLDESNVLAALAGELCEGPCWDTRRSRLVFVDILDGVVHAVDPTNGDHDTWTVGMPVSAVAPRASGGWVAAVERGFALFDDDWALSASITPAPGQPQGTRFNDGRCDPQGRFWAGTLAYDERPRAGSLYRFDPTGAVTEILQGVTNSNGIAWAPAADVMYYVDTGRGTVDSMRFHPADGTVSDRQTLIEVSAADGLPDGLATDSEGCLWLALWDGGCVRRYTPDGELDVTLKLPVTRVTSVAFGGPDFEDLYITTAWHGLTPDQKAKQPLAGSVFRYRPGVAGRPPMKYAG